MTVENNPSAGSVQPNSSRPDGAEQAQEAAQSDGAGSSETSSADESTPGDRVEISDAARAAQSEGGGDAALVERGRAALESSSLSAERLTELRENVENGRYTQPEVTQQVARGLGEDLGTAAPGEGEG